MDFCSSRRLNLNFGLTSVPQRIGPFAQMAQWGFAFTVEIVVAYLPGEPNWLILTGNWLDPLRCLEIWIESEYAMVRPNAR
jgi:hypothetical protein